MILNNKSWELVKNGSFVVGDRVLVNQGITYHPGDEYPNDHSISMYALYDTNSIEATDSIIEVLEAAEPILKKKTKTKGAS